MEFGIEKCARLIMKNGKRQIKEVFFSKIKKVNLPKIEKQCFSFNVFSILQFRVGFL